MARDALIAAGCFLLAGLVWRITPRVERSCWRCAGVGQVQRWHRLGWRPCPRCGRR